MEEKVNLEGTEWISNIPGIYFDSVSQLVERFPRSQAPAWECI